MAPAPKHHVQLVSTHSQEPLLAQPPAQLALPSQPMAPNSVFSLHQDTTPTPSIHIPAPKEPTPPDQAPQYAQAVTPTPPIQAASVPLDLSFQTDSASSANPVTSEPTQHPLSRVLSGIRHARLVITYQMALASQTASVSRAQTPL